MSLFHDEMANLNGDKVARILWDMEKFYDNIDIIKLIDRSMDLEYPVIMMALGIQMHMAPRCINAYETYAICDLPKNGIIAGCTQSNIFARILLHRIMKQAVEAIPPPLQMLRSFVDDISQAIQSDKEEVVIDTTIKGAVSLAQDLIGSGNRISPKSVIMASNARIKRTIVKKMRLLGVKLRPV